MTLYRCDKCGGLAYADAAPYHAAFTVGGWPAVWLMLDAVCEGS